MHTLKKDVLAFEDQNKEAQESRRHVQRAHGDSVADSNAQIGIMLGRINELDSLVTLKDKFMEQKVAVEARIKETNGLLEQAETSGLKSPSEIEARKEELKVRFFLFLHVNQANLNLFIIQNF